MHGQNQIKFKLYGQLRLEHDQQNFQALYFCVDICLFIFCLLILTLL